MGESAFSVVCKEQRSRLQKPSSLRAVFYDELFQEPVDVYHST